MVPVTEKKHFFGTCSVHPKVLLFSLYAEDAVLQENSILGAIYLL